MPEVNGINIPFLPVGGVESLKKTQTPFKEPGKKSFDDILNEEITRLKFSQHAKNRVEARNLDISSEDLTKLDEAVDKASEKGAKDSLIFLRDMAFIVNVKNRTVITALDSEQIKDNVFTNIDSVLIAK
ncbi:MAG TPA: TIGR02530 family flagellar biosynthesis protein [Bacteroidota bacterium]|jgi:flagellar operon protein|nr:TIGR02530 family flagellar biosynthesis protein [Bacteroidota bacterium]